MCMEVGLTVHKTVTQHLMDKLFRPVSTSGINALGPVVENSNKCVFVLISMLGRVINNVVLVLVLSRFNTVFPKERGSNVRESGPFSQDDLSNPQICSTRVGLEVWTTGRSYGIKVTKRMSLNSRIRTQAFTWNRHGFLLLAAPERSLLKLILLYLWTLNLILDPQPVLMLKSSVHVSHALLNTTTEISFLLSTSTAISLRMQY